MPTRLKSPQGTEAEVDNTVWHSASEAVVDIHHNRANLIRQKITLAEMRAANVRGLLIYCSDYHCSHRTALSRDRWPARASTSTRPAANVVVHPKIVAFYCAAPRTSSPINLRKCFGRWEIVTPAQSARALSRSMTIHQLFKNTAFGPDEIERLVMAYEQTLRALRLTDRNDPITQLVAEKIIAIGRMGIEDPAEITKLALKQLGPPQANR